MSPIFLKSEYSINHLLLDDVKTNFRSFEHGLDHLEKHDDGVYGLRGSEDLVQVQVDLLCLTNVDVNWGTTHHTEGHCSGSVGGLLEAYSQIELRGLIYTLSSLRTRSCSW